MLEGWDATSFPDRQSEVVSVPLCRLKLTLVRLWDSVAKAAANLQVASGT